MAFKDHFISSPGKGSKRTKYVPILGTVGKSSEFLRVFSLPRRVFDLDSYPDVTPMFAKSGLYDYRKIQSAAIYEAALMDALFGIIGVGWGKTLIALSLARAFDAKRPLYMVPADLKKQVHREIDTFYSKHFDLPLDNLTIMSYNDLSDPRNAHALEDGDFDAFIGDECHKLKHKKSVRTGRFLAFAKERPTPVCKYAFMSGTVTNRSIKEYGHLLEIAFGKNSPAPRGYHDLNDWSGAIDVNPEYRTNPGALKLFCRSGESIRDGYRRRLLETCGVVSTSEESLIATLIIKKTVIPIPESVATLMDQVERTWTLGDKVFLEAVHKVAAKRQLASGFWYEPDWGEEGPDFEYIEAKKNWLIEVNRKLKTGRRPGMDSEALLARAAERFSKWEQKGFKGERPKNAWDSGYWDAWKKVKDRPEPPNKTIWVDDFVVDYAIKWSKKRKNKKRSIIWCKSNALSQRIAEKGNLPLYGTNTDASESKHPVIVCTIDTQGTGKNLQHHYDKNLICELQPNGETFQQLVGRTHRPGQESDEVYVEWLAHTPELESAMEQIIEDCTYQQESSGQPQAVLFANTL